MFTRILRPLILGFALSLLAMPSGRVAAQQIATEELVWPLPPDPPRIRYVGQVRAEADIGKKRSLLGRMTGALVGTEDLGSAIERPHDVYVEEDGKLLFVSDGGTGKVMVFDVERQEVRFLGEEGPGALAKPMGLDGDGAGRVYVSDPATDRVVAFSAAGDFLRAYGGSAILHNPVDVAVNPEVGRLYVVDSYLHQVVIFSLESGDVVGRIGADRDDLAAKREVLREMKRAGKGAEQHSMENLPETESAPGHEAGEVEPSDLYRNRSSEPGEFRYPGFIALGPDGTIYVTDQMNFRVQAFDPEGSFLLQIGAHGSQPGQFARPKGLDVDSEGHLYVADGAFNNVQIFNREGDLLLSFSSIGGGEGEVWLPLGMFIDPENRIYLADRYNNRIQIYRYLEAPDTETGSETEGLSGKGS